MAEYHVENFGCRASRADGEAIDDKLRHHGLRPAAGASTADVVIVNTCSVTAHADRTARAFLRRVRRENPSARILVTGCYAQRVPSEVAELEGVDAVVGNSHKALVPEVAVKLAEHRFSSLSSPFAREGFFPVGALQSGESSVLAVDPLHEQQHNHLPARPGAFEEGQLILVDEVFAHSSFSDLSYASMDSSTRSQTRPNLKIQDGCGNRCSFCIIPTTRGHSRSMSMEACQRSVEAFVAAGGRELVLSGINLGRWGRDLSPSRTLEELVSVILSRTSLERLRLSSVEPMDWTPSLIALFAKHASGENPRLARHAHLPLQSGSDAILRAMHRRYRPWHYAAKLDAIRYAMPQAAIGADVMVGFPGESDLHFEESFAFIAAQPFTYLHLFPFSPRPGTQAWSLQRESPVPPQAVEERMERLRRLISGKNLAFRQTLLGRVLPVLTLKTPETEQREGVTRALTDNFLEVEIEGRFPANQVLRVAISAIKGEGLAGCPAA